MSLGEVLESIGPQALAEGYAEVIVSGQTYWVGRTQNRRLRTVRFVYEEHRIDGIEENPEKTSRWARLAREGTRVMQFPCRNHYFANVCEGKLTRYPAWTSLGLPT